LWGSLLVKASIEISTNLAKDMLQELVAFHLETNEKQKAVSAKAKEKAARAANALHDKPGGTRQKQKTIRAAWESGKYSSRDLCAEQECAAIGMSFSAARKALRNTPEPKKG
jgi:hypothetical protein